MFSLRFFFKNSWKLKLSFIIFLFKRLINSIEVKKVPLTSKEHFFFFKDLPIDCETYPVGLR